MKDVDLGEPTSFLDHVDLGCTQRECQISNDIVENSKSMSESRISAGAMENDQKLKLQGNLRHTISSWSYDMASNAKKRGKILRTGEQNDSTVIQSRNTML